MGTRELMGGDSGGFMVDDDMDMFIEKTWLLLTDKELYRTKSKEAIRHIDKWTIDLHALRMLKLYNSLVQKSHVHQWREIIVAPAVKQVEISYSLT
jgi:hypothetical protein